MKIKESTLSHLSVRLPISVLFAFFLHIPSSVPNTKLIWSFVSSDECDECSTYGHYFIRQLSVTTSVYFNNSNALAERP